MRDELYDRDYQAGRDALHEGIDRLIARLSETFEALQDIQFAAPWAEPAKRARRSGLA